jgi:hypothetical protein
VSASDPGRVVSGRRPGTAARSQRVAGRSWLLAAPCRALAVWLRISAVMVAGAVWVSRTTPAHHGEPGRGHRQHGAVRCEPLIEQPHAQRDADDRPRRVESARSTPAGSAELSPSVMTFAWLGRQAAGRRPAAGQALACSPSRPPLFQGASRGPRPAARPAAEGLDFSVYSPGWPGHAVPDRAGLRADLHHLQPEGKGSGVADRPQTRISPGPDTGPDLGFCVAGPGFEPG